MRHLLCLLIVFGVVGTASATWTHTQIKNTTNCSSPCAVTVTSTGAHHLLVAGIFISNLGLTISAVTAGACNVAWVHAPNSASSGTGDGSGDLYYCTDSVAAITSISITAAGCSSNCVGLIWEASSSLGNIAIDSGATPSGNVTDTTCTACAGVSLTLSGNNDYIVGMAECGTTCTGLTGTGWTNDLANPSGDGVGHGITSGSQTAPLTWAQASGTLVASAAAFQESSGAGAPKPPPAVIY